MAKLIAVPGPQFVGGPDLNGDMAVSIPDPFAAVPGELGLPLAGVQYMGDTYPSPSMLYGGEMAWETASGSGLWDYADPNPV